MKKLIILLICLLVTPASAPMEPMLGVLPDWSRFPQPVALWAMNEGSGNIVQDLSGNGTVVDVVGTVPWVSGKAGPALDIPDTGNSNYLYKDGIKGVSSSGTVIWRVYLDSLIATSGHITSYEAGTVNATMHLNGLNTGALRCYHYNTGGTLTVNFGAAITTTLVAGQWIDLAYTWEDGIEAVLYKNGVFVASDTALAGTLRAPGKMYMGTDRAVASRGLDGRLEYVYVFDRALTASQIAYLYQNSFPWFERTPVELLEAGIAVAPTGGQVIFINLSSMGYGYGVLGLVIFLAILKKMRNKRS